MHNQNKLLKQQQAHQDYLHSLPNTTIRAWTDGYYVEYSNSLHVVKKLKCKGGLVDNKHYPKHLSIVTKTIKHRNHRKLIVY